MAKVSRSGATASRPDETGIAHCGRMPRIVRDSMAGSASEAPTMKCVIAEAMMTRDFLTPDSCLLALFRGDSRRRPNTGVRARPDIFELQSSQRHGDESPDQQRQR